MNTCKSKTGSLLPAPSCLPHGQLEARPTGGPSKGGMAATWGRVSARGDLQSQEGAKQGRCTGRWPSTELDTKQAEESPHPSLEVSAKGGERHLITVGGGWGGGELNGNNSLQNAALWRSSFDLSNVRAAFESHQRKSLNLSVFLLT